MVEISDFESPREDEVADLEDADAAVSAAQAQAKEPKPVVMQNLIGGPVNGVPDGDDSSQ